MQLSTPLGLRFRQASPIILGNDRGSLACNWRWRASHDQILGVGTVVRGSIAMPRHGSKRARLGTGFPRHSICCLRSYIQASRQRGVRRDLRENEEIAGGLEHPCPAQLQGPDSESRVQYATNRIDIRTRRRLPSRRFGVQSAGFRWPGPDD